MVRWVGVEGCRTTRGIHHNLGDAKVKRQLCRQHRFRLLRPNTLRVRGMYGRLLGRLQVSCLLAMAVDSVVDQFLSM